MNLLRVIWLTCFCALSNFVTAQSFKDKFISKEDGAVDVSGFLPVPILITEPAVGYGGG